MNAPQTHDNAPSCDFTAQNGVDTVPLPARVVTHFFVAGWELTPITATGTFGNPRWVGRKGEPVALIWGVTQFSWPARIIAGFNTMYWQPNLHPTHKFLCAWDGLFDDDTLQVLHHAGIATVTFEVQS